MDTALGGGNSWTLELEISAVSVWRTSSASNLVLVLSVTNFLDKPKVAAVKNKSDNTDTTIFFCL